MKSLKLVLVFLCLVMIITSCSKTANQGRLIPMDATMVIVINAKSLSSKLSWDEIKQTSWYQAKSMDSNMSAWHKQLMSNPDITGIDSKADFILFAIKNGKDGQVVFEGDIKDSKAFEAFNKHFDSTATVVKDGSMSYTNLKNKAVLGWNDSKFVLVVNAPMKNNFNQMGNFQSDSTKQPAIPTTPVDLMPLCKKIFALSSDSSLYKNQKFAALVNEEGDVHFMANVGQIMKSASMGMLNMLKLDKYLEGNIITATLNFDNGKITVKQKNYAGKELTDIYKKYLGGSVNGDMLKNLPASDVAAAAAFHFKPEAITELIKLAGVDGLANMGLAQAGLTLDDFTKAMKGDFQLSVSGIKLKTDSMGGLSGKPDMSVVFAMSVNDKDAVDKLLNAMKKLPGGMSSNKDVVFKNTGQYLVIGSNQQAVDNFLTGNKSAPAFTEKVKDHPTFVYVDIQMMMKAFQPVTRDSTQQKLFTLNQSMWDNLYMYGGEFSDGGYTANYEINLMDKTTNSLKQLNKLIDQVYPLHEHKKHETMESMKDSTVSIQMNDPMPTPK